MNPIRIYITTPEQLEGSRPGDLGTYPIGVDTETTDHEHQKGVLEPWDGEISLLQFSDGRVTLIVDVLAIGNRHIRNSWIREVVESPNILKIAQNAKFEMKWMMYHLGFEPETFYDTKLASQIIAAGDPTARHSLADIAPIYAGIEVDKEEQLSNWGARPLTQSQLDYAAIDAEVVIPIREGQLPRLEADDLTRTAMIEFDAIRPIVRAEINGLYLNKERWTELLVEKTAELTRLESEMLEIFQAGVDWTTKNPEKTGKRPVKPKKPVDPRRAKVNKGRTISTEEILQYEKAMGEYQFEQIEWQKRFHEWESLPDEVTAVLNPGSWQQMLKVIKNVTGLKLPDTNNLTLIQYTDKHPEIAKLVEYRTAKKSVESYGENYLEAAKRDGRVHTSFKQILDTGRMSASDPNNQNIPHDERHRRCFTAPEGCKLVIADYSQIELRILAQFSNDPVFIQDILSGDPHSQGAVRFGLAPSIDQVPKDVRQDVKKTNFGVVYGIGDNKLGIQIDKPAKYAGQLKKSYFDTYKGNDRFLNRGNRQAQNHLFARTSSGRIQRFNHDGSKGQISAIGRNGQNMPIQGTAADMMKRALYLQDAELVRRGLQWTIKLVNIVHDEVVDEAPNELAELAAEILSTSMEQAGREYVSVVPVLAEAMIADEWIKE